MHCQECDTKQGWLQVAESTGRAGSTFPDLLAQQAAELCKRLAAERERELVEAQAELLEERNRLKAKNLFLESELQAARDPADEVPCFATTDQIPSAETLATTQEPGDEGLLAHWKLPQERESLRLSSVQKSAESIGFKQGESSSHDARGWRSLLPHSFSMKFAQSDNVETAHSQFMLRKVYKDLDRRRVGLICAQDLAAKTHRGPHNISDLQDAIEAVNALLVKEGNKHKQGANSKAAGESCELTFEGFQYLVMHKHIEDLVGPTVASTIQELREYHVKWTTEAMILEKTRLSKDDLSRDIEKDKIPVWLEPLIGVLILLNAICIGISQDLWVDQEVWTVLEAIFSVFFLLELMAKLYFVGWSDHFFGPAFAWNWFDLGVVIIALVGVCLDKFDPDSHELGSLTIIRLIRVVRMARLVRLLRMKVFKELALMVNGVIGGLKTLCWAFVFLLVLVFILGILMRQISSSGRDLHHHLLFSSVPLSMFTVFRCLIGDCTAPDGQSLAIQLTQQFGFFFTVGYVSVTCFVLFGVFNLIAAIFVENTLEAARVSQQKRQQLRTKEHVRVAQELREIVLRICRRDRSFKSGSFDPKAPLVRRNANRLGKALRRTFMPAKNPRKEKPAEDEVDALEMSVSRPVFEEVMQDPVVVDIMEDLEINVNDRSKLFDIIDSNGSGSLDVGEIIEGLMKLRGPADKGDIVCASLMVRSVQRDLHRLDAEMHERHRVLSKSQSDMRELLATAVKGLQSHAAVCEEQGKACQPIPSKLPRSPHHTSSGTRYVSHKTQMI